MVHNSQNQVCEGLLLDIEKDELLDFLHQHEPMARDRVALNERGVAVDKGKYDFVAVPSGARFSFELKLQTEDDHSTQWQMLLGLLNAPQFRLGQKTRSGLGQVKVIGAYQFTANLMEQADQQRFHSLSKRLGDITGMQTLAIDSIQSNNSAKNNKQYCLDVQAEGGLRVGQGHHAFDHSLSKPADALIWSEPRIQWTGTDQASIQKYQRVIPASGIKGALVHRTLYHYRRLTQDFIDESSNNKAKDFAHIELPEALQGLFGIVTQDNSIPAQAGSIMIDDIYLDDQNLQVMTRQHNSIDRFTGGTREHVLFSEEILWQPRFSIHITLNNSKAFAAHSIEAFECALHDLTQGDLAIGAGSSKGHGYLEGTLNVND
jgi:CRISPR/Cas system CSM-associated protein Csm3 (group 7 of RAMP superfamily)